MALKANSECILILFNLRFGERLMRYELGIPACREWADLYPRRDRKFMTLWTSRDAQINKSEIAQLFPKIFRVDVQASKAGGDGSNFDFISRPMAPNRR
jgi:hypothetical protein